jgi:histidine triad (HIT) family protein
MTKTLFQKIIDREIPGEFLYEDELCVVLKDIYPKAPVHVLVIPRKPIPTIMDLEEEDRELMSHLIFVAKKIAAEQKCEGYRLQFNVGAKGGQDVFHIHLHLLGWPA